MSEPFAWTYRDAPSGNYYAAARDRRIYRLDPAMAGTGILTEEVPFNICSVAFDPATETVFYIEDTNTHFRLGKYEIGSDQHTVLGDMGKRLHLQFDDAPLQPRLLAGRPLLHRPEYR
ncbi:MAG: hypothetical protein R3F11_07710 [Verrucomicrobiales bacterium]